MDNFADKNSIQNDLMFQMVSAKYTRYFQPHQVSPKNKQALQKHQTPSYILPQRQNRQNSRTQKAHNQYQGHPYYAITINRSLPSINHKKDNVQNNLVKQFYDSFSIKKSPSPLKPGKQGNIPKYIKNGPKTQRYKNRCFSYYQQKQSINNKKSIIQQKLISPKKSNNKLSSIGSQQLFGNKKNSKQLYSKQPQQASLLKSFSVKVRQRPPRINGARDRQIDRKFYESFMKTRFNLTKQRGNKYLKQTRAKFNKIDRQKSKQDKIQPWGQQSPL